MACLLRVTLDPEERREQGKGEEGRSGRLIRSASRAGRKETPQSAMVVGREA